MTIIKYFVLFVPLLQVTLGSSCPTCQEFVGEQELLLKELKETSVSFLSKIAEMEEKIGTYKELCQNKAQKIPLGHKANPAFSCREIYEEAPFYQKPDNHPYWIRTDNGKAVELFCDMSKGGWTLIGQISGRGNIYDSWLIKNYNVHILKTPLITSGTYGFIGARKMAVYNSTKIRFSSGENEHAMGQYWVEWELPRGREVESLWNHSVGYAVVKLAPNLETKVHDWRGRTKLCYQNKYGIMKYGQHGGSYPATSYNLAGNTITGDICMAVGVFSSQSDYIHGWHQNKNGYDSPQSNTDWPNTEYNHLKPYLSVWLY